MAVLPTSDENNLPDSAFLYVESGGKKDAQGKTTPRGLRHFPIKDTAGNLDMAHLRNALSRIPQSNVPDAVKKSCVAAALKLLSAAKAKQGQMKESALTHASGLREAGLQGLPAVDSQGVIPDCILIRSGMNAVGSRYYTPEFLRQNVSRAEGALCFLDHPTVAEAAQRPERSIKDVAARVVRSRWDDREKALVGDLHLLESDAGKQAKGIFADPGVREVAGLSIYYPYGVSSRYMTVDGRAVDVPETLAGPDGARFNFDFVTLPTAGGRVGVPA